MSLWDDALAAARRAVEDGEAVLRGQASNAEVRAATAESTAAGLRVELGAQVARFDALRAEFDAYRAAHPDEKPPAAKVLLGGSYGAKADKSRYGGRSTSARIFIEGPLPADVTTDAQWRRAYSEGNRVMVVSWKGTQTGSQVAGAFSNVPADVTVYGCYFHEPEDNIAKGDLKLADWRARSLEHNNALASVGVVPTTILMQYTLADGSGRNHMDYANVGADTVGWDFYMNPAKGKDNPEAAVDRMVAAAREMGAKTVGVAETGVPNTVAEATRVDLIKRLRVKLQNTPAVVWATFWSSGEFAFTDQTADAWFA